ncbi:hypothetical protein H2199_004332 [Coniosporium tulheliwenetii]|nr:hypothetical protein H2199_004332 [Cladosporium sp. JES 115]
MRWLAVPLYGPSAVAAAGFFVGCAAFFWLQSEGQSSATRTAELVVVAAGRSREEWVETGFVVVGLEQRAILRALLNDSSNST